METAMKTRPLLAMSRGKLIAIIPDSIKPALPVKVSVAELNSERCVVKLVPTEEKGTGGYKSNSGNGHWAYEVVQSDRDTRFGRTFSEANQLEDGSIELRTAEPLREIRAMTKTPKAKKLTRVDKAIETVLKMPAPVKPVDPASLGELVRSINTLKTQLGDTMTLRVGSNGLLTAVLEYS